MTPSGLKYIYVFREVGKVTLFPFGTVLNRVSTASCTRRPETRQTFPQLSRVPGRRVTLRTDALRFGHHSAGRCGAELNKPVKAGISEHRPGKTGNRRNSPASMRHVLPQSKAHQAASRHLQKKTQDLHNRGRNGPEGGGSLLLQWPQEGAEDPRFHCRHFSETHFDHTPRRTLLLWQFWKISFFLWTEFPLLHHHSSTRLY